MYYVAPHVLYIVAMLSKGYATLLYEGPVYYISNRSISMHYTCTATHGVNLATLHTVFYFRVIHHALQRTAHLIEWFRFVFHYFPQASYAFNWLIGYIDWIIERYSGRGSQSLNFANETP